MWFTSHVNHDGAVATPLVIVSSSKILGIKNRLEKAAGCDTRKRDPTPPLSTPEIGFGCWFLGTEISQTYVGM
jgi:hypothetical protein